MRGGGSVVVMILVGAFALAGCQYLLGLSPVAPDGPFPSFDPGTLASFEPDYSLPPPTAIFADGTATVTIASTTATLDRLVGRGASYEGFGTEVTWTDGEGLYLRFFGSGAPADDVAFVSLDRIRDGAHWTTIDPTVCTVTVTRIDAAGLAGSASCKGLRWTDTMTGLGGGLEPSYVEGEAPFDAEITFEAAP